MDGQIIEFNNLPSKGFAYPDDIEIYVKPMSIKEQIDIDRYGITQAEYFQIILNGISIHGNFNKNNLLFADVNFMDIVRRLYSFDTKDVITIEKETCMFPDCQHEFNFDFKMTDIEFTDFDKDIFGKHFVLGKGTEDELDVVVSPLTVGEFITMSKQVRNMANRKDSLSSVFLEYCCTCIREVEGRSFKSKVERDAFLKDYIANLTSAADKKVVKAIEDETVVQVKPFKYICDNCGRETEVWLRPTSNFQQ